MKWPKEKLSLKDRIIVHSTGVFERGVYMILLVSNLSAAGAFIGTWILAKTITGWNFTQTQIADLAPELRKGITPGMANRRAFVSLQGSLVSLFFAFLGAWLWCPEAF